MASLTAQSTAAAIESIQLGLCRTWTPFLYQTRTLASREPTRRPRRDFIERTPTRFQRSLHVSSQLRMKTTSGSHRFRSQLGGGLKSTERENGDLDREAVGRTVVRKVSVTLKSDQPHDARRENKLRQKHTEKVSLPDDYQSIPFSRSEEEDDLAFSSLSDSFQEEESFNDEFGELETNSEPIARPVRESTITIAEKHAFQRIFADIFARSKLSNEDEMDHPTTNRQSSASINIAAKGREPVKSLDFTAGTETISGLGRPSFGSRHGGKSQEQLKVDIDRYPLPLRAAAAKAMGLVSVRSSELLQEDSTGDVDELEHIRQPERERVERMMRSANTDIELWQVMEREVFSLIEKLGLAESNRAPEEGKRPRGRKRKNPPEARGGSREQSANGSERQLDITTYGPLYPSHLLLGLRLLDRSFVKPSPLVLNVLPRVKSLGIISHVLGASTALYNELIRIYWTRYDNLTGVSKLLTEMDQAGLDLDTETLTVVNDIIQMQRRARGGDNASALRALWSLPEFATGRFRIWREKIQASIEERNPGQAAEIP